MLLGFPHTRMVPFIVHMVPLPSPPHQASARGPSATRRTPPGPSHAVTCQRKLCGQTPCHGMICRQGRAISARAIWQCASDWHIAATGVVVTSPGTRADQCHTLLRCVFAQARACGSTEGLTCPMTPEMLILSPTKKGVSARIAKKQKRSCSRACTPSVHRHTSDRSCATPWNTSYASDRSCISPLGVCHTR